MKIQRPSRSLRAACGSCSTAGSCGIHTAAGPARQAANNTENNKGRTPRWSLI